jgi:hypothetical protein
MEGRSDSLLPIKIGFGNLLADMIEDDNGLMILICFGTSGTDSAALVFVGDMSCTAVDDGLAIERRITRGVGLSVDCISLAV